MSYKTTFSSLMKVSIFLFCATVFFSKSGKLYVYPNKITKTVHMVTGFSSSSHSEDKLCV